MLQVFQHSNSTIFNEKWKRKICSEFFRDQEKKYLKFSKKNKGFSLVKNRLHYTLKRLIKECSPESLYFDGVYFIFWGPVFWMISAFRVSEVEQFSMYRKFQIVHNTWNFALITNPGLFFLILNFKLNFYWSKFEPIRNKDFKTPWHSVFVCELKNISTYVHYKVFLFFGIWNL